MARRVQTAFKTDGIMVPIAKILPLKKVSPETKQSRTYKRILASVQEVGLIEPLVVYPKGGKDGEYSLLDGHSRQEVLKDLGRGDAFCLVAPEDEAYTYNHQVSLVSPIQEHFMILKAVESGVPEERIARALNVDVASIRQKRDLLKGVCEDAVELLRDKHASAEAVRLLRNAQPMRQIEMAELMVAAGNYSAAYARLLLTATPPEQLVDAERLREARELKPDDPARIEREVNGLGRDLKMREDSYGKNMLHLVLTAACLRVEVGASLARAEVRELLAYERRVRADNAARRRPKSA